MTRRGAIWTFIALVMLALSASWAAAGPSYSVKLSSGKVYQLELVTPGHFTVKNSSGAKVGAIESRGAASFEVFDADTRSLGSVSKINPDGVALIDAHLSGGF